MWSSRWSSIWADRRGPNQAKEQNRNSHVYIYIYTWPRCARSWSTTWLPVIMLVKKPPLTWRRRLVRSEQRADMLVVTCHAALRVDLKQSHSSSPCSLFICIYGNVFGSEFSDLVWKASSNQFLPLVVLVGPPWALVGSPCALWAPLAPLCAPLGRLWDPLGLSWALPWALVGSPCALVGAPCALVCSPRALVGPPRALAPPL